MKKIIVLIWNTKSDFGKIFGVYTSKDEYEKAIVATSENISTTVENLKSDLYYYEVEPNKLGQVF